MIEYRVTKYDPAYRDASGVFQREDWTSFGDIGSAFHGAVLTANAYERVEDAYIASAIDFWREAGRPLLYVRGLENHHASVDAPRDGDVVPEADLDRLIRRVLREELWCRLEGKGFLIHFGWELYMYLGTPAPCPAAIAAAHLRGVFVEEHASPYHDK